MYRPSGVVSSILAIVPEQNALVYSQCHSQQCTNAETWCLMVTQYAGMAGIQLLLGELSKSSRVAVHHLLLLPIKFLLFWFFSRFFRADSILLVANSTKPWTTVISAMFLSFMAFCSLCWPHHTIPQPPAAPPCTSPAPVMLMHALDHVHCSSLQQPDQVTVKQ